MKGLLVILAVFILASCTSVSSLQQSQLTSGYYSYKSKEAVKDFSKVYVYHEDDSMVVYPLDQRDSAGTGISFMDGQFFQKHSLDLDVLIVPFKYRPGTENLPSQLNTDFNGNLFLGYRRDRYFAHRLRTPVGSLSQIKQRAYSVGSFIGLGTSFISPWTTNNKATDEYTGFTLSYGVSALWGYKDITVGLAVGWDNLLDRDKDIWIYQNKAWYGLTLSLNLN